MDATNTGRLSRVASAIWRAREFYHIDYEMDGSGDCGSAIAAGHRSYELRIVAEAGYATPGEYNADLRSRMVGPDGRMSLRVHTLLSALEIENVCPACGAALDVTVTPTANYGGGFDTFERCPACGYGEVYV